MWRVAVHREIIQGKSMETCSGTNFMRGSCPRVNYSGKNVRGSKSPGDICSMGVS